MLMLYYNENLSEVLHTAREKQNFFTEKIERKRITYQHLTLDYMPLISQIHNLQLL